MIDNVEVESRFAPLNPDGVLPHSISASLIGAVYKGNVKRALKDAGVVSRSIPRKKLRRNSLDDPKVREKVGFAQLIYSYSRQATWGKHIYTRLVEPAESGDVEREKKIVLDAKKFEGLIEGFLREQESPIQVVSHSSEWKALALMVIGYSITQPDDRRTICLALCRLGPGFSEYLAIRETADPESTDTQSVSGSETEKTYPTGQLSAGQLEAEKENKKEKIGGALSSVEEMSLLKRKLAEQRIHRQALGSAYVLDSSAFD